MIRRTLVAIALVVASGGGLLLALQDGAGATLIGDNVSHAREVDSCGSASYDNWHTWWINSPYYGVGFYLGGAWATDASCLQPGATWASNVQGYGFDLIPIWDGLQSQCSGLGRDLFSNDSFTAFGQGESAAQAAYSRAVNVGFPANSIIYLDVEPMPNVTSTCLTAAKSFVSGFDNDLNALGWHYGLYASECNPDIDWAANITPAPQHIWYANTGTGKEPLDSNLQCMSSTSWASDHRLHQYYDGPTNQGSTETYGGVTITVDRDCVHGRIDGFAWTPSGNC